MSNRWDPLDSLEPFFEDGLITDILRVVKSGKEATVYCCRTDPRLGGGLAAAKVYRPREGRSFQNDAVYRQGRTMTDSRLRRAAKNRSRKGREVLFGTWVGHEAAALGSLHAAGVSVPRLLGTASDALLMEFVGDESGAAPRLADVTLQAGEARRLFAALVRDIEKMLAAGHVHGDLSPFNLLYWRGGLTIIDVPQTVDPFANPNARDLLARDLENVCVCFAEWGVYADAEVLTRRLWRLARMPITR